jgi:hypothetical protein
MPISEPLKTLLGRQGFYMERGIQFEPASILEMIKRAKDKHGQGT